MKINVDRLKIAMAENCITAVELSNKAKVSRGTITNLMGNKTDASPATIGKMAKALGVSIEELIIDEKGAATPNENEQDSRSN